MAIKDKVEARRLMPGDVFFPTKSNKTAVVVSSTTIELPVTRRVLTTVVTYRYEGEDDESELDTLRDIHLPAKRMVKAKPKREAFIDKLMSTFFSKKKKEVVEVEGTETLVQVRQNAMPTIFEAAASMKSEVK